MRNFQKRGAKNRCVQNHLEAINQKKSKKYRLKENGEQIKNIIVINGCISKIAKNNT